MDKEDIRNKIMKAKINDKEALEDIVKSFTPFIIKTAKCTFIRHHDFQDLEQIGKMSVIKAVNMYDVNKGNGFTTYVVNSIKRGFYYLIRQNVKNMGCCSLNSLNNEGEERINAIASEENFEEDIFKDIEKTLLRKALNMLCESEKEIIYWFYFKNKTLQDYAKFKVISYRTASDRKRKILLKLKKSLEEMGYHGDI